MFKNLYAYRELLKTSVKKDIRGKYKGSILGFLWAFLNPLLMLTIYSLVFPHILRVEEANYTMFIFVALIPWTYFTNSVVSGAATILANANIIKKVYFPREILPISVVTGATINFLISCVIILIALAVTGIGFSYYILFFPLILLIQYIITLAIVFIVACLTPYFRDLEHIIGVFMIALFYATPIIYPLSLIPESFRWVLNLNPLARIIMAYRDILYYQQIPNLGGLFKLGIISVVLCVFGYYIFNKLQKGFAEEL